MSMKKALCIFFSSAVCCAAQSQAGNLLKYVNPMIGTQRMGHVFPGATVPFGMVQLSPDTDTVPYAVDGRYNPDVYKYCAGYQYDDKTIVGFSHTHFSGTGHADLGDFLIMPTTGALQLNPGTAGKPEAGFRSRFSHDNETAEPNYYKVKLDDHNILAELTTTTRVGMHQYTFPKANDAHIILDLMSGIYNYDEKNVWTFVRVENDTLVTGFRQTHGWGRTRVLYFAMSFSKPFKEYGSKNFATREVYRGFWRKFDQSKNFPELAGKQLRMYFNFDTEEGEKLKIKFALSAVSTHGALLNLRTEAPGWDFDAVKKQGQEQWQKELGKINITAPEQDKVNFYTSMYHAFINPTVYMDVDGRYRGLDQNIHEAKGFVNYTTFSLWDTYRALHPLYNIIQPKRNADAIQSMLAHYDQSTLKMLPVWSNSANENWCMTGYHAVSVIADAAVKGNAGFDMEKALEACVTTARNRRYDGLDLYMDMGYIPVDRNGTGVSTTLEYAYDDWAIAQLAKKSGRMDIYEEFIKRSENYKNVFDPASGFMRARLSNGHFRSPFDPLNTHGEGFIEGNAWNFSLFVPHDPAGLSALLGGRKKFTAYLDTLFNMHLPDKYFAATEDITRDGIIGGYVHGNEPAHHVAYLYNWTDQPWKTQERVRMILKNQYHNGPDGLGGNDDTGQMSAWYIFSALGFYPVAPGAAVYQLGSPAVGAATLHLENGNTFSIEAKNQGEKNVYVQQAELNGKPLNRLTLSHEEIMNGGKLVFYMSAKKSGRR
ncbi:MAG TPA: GH92 family glycosyl hydrolase [Chitinophagaceae bacterium]|nr:GH92 family glycosyl hydrolase [Chitinophagaceae bacterium]